MATWNAMTPEPRTPSRGSCARKQRSNAGTIRGDRAVADRFLNTFFRI